MKQCMKFHLNEAMSFHRGEIPRMHFQYVQRQNVTGQR